MCLGEKVHITLSRYVMNYDKSINDYVSQWWHIVKI